MRYQELKEYNQQEQLDKIIPILEKDYSSAYEKYKKSIYRIYRGMDHPGHTSDYFLYNFNYQRVSRGTHNYYTLLIDNLPSWVNYPKRSKSAICSTSRKYASSYGTLYLVFPKNNTKIGICPKKDIWATSFLNNGEHIFFDDISEALYNLSKELDVKLTQDNFEKFKKELELLEYKFFNNTKPISEYSKSFFYNLFPNFLENMNKFINPNTINFELQTIENFNTVGSHEIWMEVPVLMVKANLLDSTEY